MNMGCKLFSCLLFSKAPEDLHRNKAMQRSGISVSSFGGVNVHTSSSLADPLHCDS
jgi:hypothetical protein